MIYNQSRKTLLEMTESERSEILSAWINGNLQEQILGGLVGELKWVPVSMNDRLKLSGVYRISYTPDSINWEHVDRKLKYLYRDKDGDAWLSAIKPEQAKTAWHCNSRYFSALGFTSYKKGSAPWDQYLVVRPGYED